MANFDPRQLLVVGGLAKGEEAKAFIQARFQAHRWMRRALKSNDPITVSVGWRRYQTIGVFSKSVPSSIFVLPPWFLTFYCNVKRKQLAGLACFKWYRRRK